MKRAIYNLILLGVITVSMTRYVFRLQRERNDWEQRYRDCQASMWMRDPTWLTNELAIRTGTNAQSIRRWYKVK